MQTPCNNLVFYALQSADVYNGKVCKDTIPTCHPLPLIFSIDLFRLQSLPEKRTINEIKLKIQLWLFDMFCYVKLCFMLRLCRVASSNYGALCKIQNFDGRTCCNWVEIIVLKASAGFLQRSVHQRGYQLSSLFLRIFKRFDLFHFCTLTINSVKGIYFSITIY